MNVEWKKPEAVNPPIGVPLIVTIKAKWKEFTEVLGPVYRLRNAVNGGLEYVNFGTGAELGAIGNSVIGPNEVRVVAWDYWPEAFSNDGRKP